MTGITFFALNSIQRDAGMNDTRYARDLGLLLSGNVTELVANNQKKEISNVAEKFWRSSRNLRYIFFTDAEDIVQLGIPISATPTSSDSQFQLTRKLKLPSELKKRPQFPLVRAALASAFLLGVTPKAKVPRYLPFHNIGTKTSVT